MELVLLLAWWTLIVRPYLDLDPTVVPTGNEYGTAIQSHYFWTRLQRCGLCALWNGSLRGGHPALVDPYGSFLHPLVALATLGWGVVNGSKLALAGAFLIAGLGQWWLARELGLGVLARLWTPALAMAAGHLSGRMEIGVFGIVISTATCSLFFPAMLRVARCGTVRSAVVLGAVLAAVVLSGQGYLQIGLAVSALSAFALIPGDRSEATALMVRFAQAGVLAVCLAAVFLIPLVRFLPHFAKDMDFEHRSVQPMALVPLNLVIDDPDFYRNEQLAKLPYPYLYTNFVGWPAVILAIAGLSMARDERLRRAGTFLAAAAVLALWAATAQPFRLLVQAVPSQWLADQVAGIRYPSVMAGLAIPPLLGLAGVGLDRIPTLVAARFRGANGARRVLTAGIATAALAALLVVLASSLIRAKTFAESWIGTTHLHPGTVQIADALRTPTLQWVNAPHGEHPYQLVAVGSGLKLATGVRTFNWRDRPLPEPVLEADRQGAPPGMAPYRFVDGITIYRSGPGREYAAIDHDGGGRTPCRASGTGGDIDVQCLSPEAGVLTLKEQRYPGWRAEVDGRAVPLAPGDWLAVEVPAGQHLVQLRYRPWDVPLGAAISALAAAVAVWILLRRG